MATLRKWAEVALRGSHAPWAQGTGLGHLSPIAWHSPAPLMAPALLKGKAAPGAATDKVPLSSVLQLPEVLK